MTPAASFKLVYAGAGLQGLPLLEPANNTGNMGSRILIDPSTSPVLPGQIISEEIVRIGVLPHRTVTATGCPQQSAESVQHSSVKGNFAMEIIQEAYPFSGIPSSAHPQRTRTCTVTEGYNPVSTTGLLMAKKVNGIVLLSPDGQGVNVDDTHFKRRTYNYSYNGQPVTQLSSFESLSNYNHFIRWYDDVVDGAEDACGVNCEPEISQPLEKYFYWSVIPTDSSSGSAAAYHYSYLVAPSEGIPEHGNSAPNHYLSFINNDAIITPNKIDADKFLIETVTV